MSTPGLSELKAALTFLVNGIAKLEANQARELDRCKRCGGEAKIEQQGFAYFGKCSKCGRQTNDYTQRFGAVMAWNGMRKFKRRKKKS